MRLPSQNKSNTIFIKSERNSPNAGQLKRLWCLQWRAHATHCPLRGGPGHRPALLQLPHGVDGLRASLGLCLCTEWGGWGATGLLRDPPAKRKAWVSLSPTSEEACRRAKETVKKEGEGGLSRLWYRPSGLLCTQFKGIFARYYWRAHKWGIWQGHFEENVERPCQASCSGAHL